MTFDNVGLLFVYNYERLINTIYLKISTFEAMYAYKIFIFVDVNDQLFC